MAFPVVMKFGGAALADGVGVEQAARIVAAREESVALVVSAHYGVTRALEDAARSAAAGSLELDRVRLRHRGLLAQLGLDPELLDRLLAELSTVLREVCDKGRLSPGELDFVLSFGERMSARVVAGALRRAGVEATPVDAFDLGLVTDGRHGGARPLPGAREALRGSLEELSGVPVVTGFLAKDPGGRLTTLGRNGSDLTAALVAEAAGARELILWKAVPGILSCDPRLVPAARPLATLGLDEAAELAHHGAEVLHPEALEPARRAGFLVRVCDARAPHEPGTTLDPELRRDELVAIACQRRVVACELAQSDPSERAADAARLCEGLRRLGLSPRFLEADARAVRAFVPPAAALEELAEELGPRLRLDAANASLALIGGSAEDGLRALALLRREGVRVRRAFLSAGARSQAFLVDPDQLERAARALHAGLLEAVAAPGA